VDATCEIDLTPIPVRRPASVEELGEIVRQARAAEPPGAIYPLGGRTMLDLGLPPARPGLGVDLRGLNTVIDYPARDMTITVQAGIPVAHLQRLLAAENQRLPLDVPRPEQATLGGALALNVSGPRRLGAGTARDYVIGITTVNDEGHETKAGGRVVKNVAGYDLCKLHVGALGTLGIITQVTLKVRPRPESQALLTFGCAAGALAGLLDHLHASRTRPTCLDIVNAPAARLLGAQGLSLPAAGWVVVVGFEDNENAVNWQIQQLIKEVTSAGATAGVEARAGAATEPLWTALTELTALPLARLSFKAGLLPGRVADFCLRADTLPGASLLLHAHAGSGIVRGHLLDEVPLEQAQPVVQALSAAAESAKGHLTLPRCPVAWKRSLPVWGAPREDFALMRQVKEKLDPQRLFNPGRFIEGI
jgi:glycolate oxidase FAD binding subunit